MDNVFIAEETAKRADAYISKISGISRSECVRLIENGDILINNSLATKKQAINIGDEIFIAEKEIEITDIIPENIPLDIIYQDSDIAVINKKQGMVVHPAHGNLTGTLVHGILYHIKDLSGINGVMRPGIVHRLDKDTSGLILIAKNDRAHLAMSEQFKSRSMEKHYRAVAFGGFKEDEGLIDAPIARHPIDRKKMAIVANGKPSQTEWKVIERLKAATYLDVHLLTGRTHQIRVHMQSIGHPLLGDVIYAPNIRTMVKIPRLLLHAYSLEFDHPATGERMKIEAPIPQVFLDTIQKLS